MKENQQPKIFEVAGDLRSSIDWSDSGKVRVLGLRFYREENKSMLDEIEIRTWVLEAIAVLLEFSKIKQKQKHRKPLMNFK